MGVDVQMFRGDEASRLLADEAFIAQWAALWDRCPWATAFQSHAFVNAWQSAYREQFEPIVVLSRAADGSLQGLLNLAYCGDEGLLVAGRFQAEYHAWVCEPDLANAFPPAALAAVRRVFPRETVLFKYLPAGTPMGWLSEPAEANRCIVTPHHRPLLRFGDGSEIEKSLGKGSNRSRLRRLEKLGGLRFRRVTDPAEFESLFDEIVRLYDFRHGAVHGSAPFCDAGNQKQFHLNMMNAPGLLHVTVLEAAGRLAAAHFGAVGKREVNLGTIVHDPCLAKHSPGKFLILMLARLLLQEGHEQFDLTPGGDAYKERFASACDEVHTITFAPTPLARRKTAMREAAKSACKRLLARGGLTPKHARNALRRTLQLAPHTPVLLLRTVRRWIAMRDEHLLLARELPSEVDPPRRNMLAELLAYEPGLHGPSRQALLADALRRVEEGEIACTCVRGGQLTQLSWMVQAADDERVRQIMGDGALMRDMSQFGEVEPVQCEQMLQIAVADAVNSLHARQLHILVPADHQRLLAAAEKLGFICRATFIASRHLGRLHQHVEMYPAAAEALQPARSLQPACVKSPLVDASNLRHCSDSLSNRSKEKTHV